MPADFRHRLWGFMIEYLTEAMDEPKETVLLTRKEKT